MKVNMYLNFKVESDVHIKTASVIFTEKGKS